jgi:Na+/H+ antiporter NhaA
MERPTAGSLVALKRFIAHEATGGLVLVVAAALALLATNIQGLAQLYDWLSIFRCRSASARSL